MENLLEPTACGSESKTGTNVLILSKSLGGEGGVVNFVSMLLGKLSTETTFEHLEIGRGSSDRSYLSKVRILLQDSRALLNRLASGEFELLHLNTSLNLKALARDSFFLHLAFLFGFRKTIIFIHGWDDAFAISLENNPLKRRIFCSALCRAKRLIVLSSRFRDSLARMGVSPGKTHVFTTMFDGDLFAEASPARVAEAGTILFLSRLVPEKGIYELLEAVESLGKVFKELQLDIAGDGPERQAIAEWVNSRGLGDKVRLLGYLRGKDKVRAFAGARIFALPTRHGEGCPVTLLEAMAAGLPVITTAVGGIPEVFTDRRNGILLQDNHPATIAGALAALLENSELCYRIRENNRRQAWERFEARIVAGRLESLYREVASEP